LVRLRFPELFNELGVTALQVARRVAALQVARRSTRPLSQSTVYRWQQLEGRVRTIDCEVIEDLCEALGVGLTDVIELDRRRKHR
jgi:DNA-binding Xre family transcriptional regulator